MQPHSFSFVSRCAKSFAGEVEWVYWCSCDSTRGELVDCLGSHVEVSIQELENRLNTCLHINAMKIILSEIDAVHDISPSLQFQGRKRYLNARERKLLDSF